MPTDTQFFGIRIHSKFDQNWSRIFSQMSNMRNEYDRYICVFIETYLNVRYQLPNHSIEQTLFTQGQIKINLFSENVLFIS